MSRLFVPEKAPVMLFRDLPIDPYTVLEVARTATPQEIREAFHRKSKKHHPDLGGDDWAFRIVVRAYEILSGSAPTPSVPEPTTPPATRHRVVAEESEQVRPGITDKTFDPERLVRVEVIWVRYQAVDVFELLDKSENRNLSGSLNLQWPDPDGTALHAARNLAPRVLPALNAAFDDLRARTNPLTARSRIDDHAFEAWLSYPSGSDAWNAFKILHVNLNARGLGVRQWTHDLAVPRESV